jgi:hypothetical protein
MIRRTIFVIAVFFAGTLLAPMALSAQQPAGLQQQIQGNWTLVSIYNEWPDGRKAESFGHAPKGSMILTPDGRFSIFLINSGIPKFAADNRIKGTAAENRTVVHGSTAYYGRYTVVNDKNGVVNLEIAGSIFPNWDGRKQTRIMSVSGDTLKVINPASAIGGKAYIIWKRGD